MMGIRSGITAVTAIGWKLLESPSRVPVKPPIGIRGQTVTIESTELERERGVF